MSDNLKDSSVSKEELARPDNFDYQGAHLANKKIGDIKEGRELLSSGSPLSVAELDTYADLARLEAEKAIFEGLARVDPLTNLERKEELATFINEQLGKDEDAVMLFIDIDHFKDVNDTFGHLVGDSVLSILGMRLNSAFPKTASNFICRFGGEEFIVVMRGVKVEDVGIKRAEQFREHIQEDSFRVFEGGMQLVLPKTVSIGVAVRDKTKTLEEWIASADKAVYAAKDKGRNTVVGASTLT